MKIKIKGGCHKKRNSKKKKNGEIEKYVRVEAAGVIGCDQGNG